MKLNHSRHQFKMKASLWSLLLICGNYLTINAQKPDTAKIIAPGKDTVKLALDLSKPGAAISPMFFGLMTEEINYSYDGASMAN